MPTAKSKAEAETPTAAGYRVLKDTTVSDVNGLSRNWSAGDVLSPLDIRPFVREKVHEGSARYMSLYEPLDDDAVTEHRQHLTRLEGDRPAEDGKAVSPPWDDYVGLHTHDVLERMKSSRDLNTVDQVRRYEAAGEGRSEILDYVAPVERAPWVGYDDLQVRQVLSKLDDLSDEEVQKVKDYEFNHRKRAAVIQYEKEQEKA